MASSEQQSPRGQQRLEAYLEAHGIDAAILHPGASTPTVPAAAEALGVKPAQIVKSLLFSGRNGDHALVIVRGTAKVDRRKLSRVSGIRKPRLAAPDVVRELTGYEAGGTPPIGHRNQMQVFLDDGVFDEPVVYGGGGEIDALLRIEPETIKELTGAVVADICEDE